MQDFTYSFEKLDVWKKSIEYVEELYTLTRSFPNDERFGLISQLRRSGISISSNLAEGSTRYSKKEKARFYQVAFGSLMESLNHLIIARHLNYVSEDDFIQIRLVIHEIANKINSLRKSLY